MLRSPPISRERSLSCQTDGDNSCEVFKILFSRKTLNFITSNSPVSVFSGGDVVISFGDHAPGMPKFRKSWFGSSSSRQVTAIFHGKHWRFSWRPINNTTAFLPESCTLLCGGGGDAACTNPLSSSEATEGFHVCRDGRA